MRSSYSRIEYARSLRLISDEPVIAAFLASREPILLPRELYYWIAGVAYDVGLVLRSRFFWANLIAGTTIKLGLGLLLRGVFR